MQISEQDRAFIKEQLQKMLPEYKFYIFGSRIKNMAKKYSDIDIAVVGNKAIPLAIFTTLEELFSQSDLPYKVDLVDYQRISQSFREIIDSHFEVLE